MPTRSVIQNVKPPISAIGNPQTIPSRFRPSWLWIVLGLLAVGALYGFVGLTWWSLPIATLMLGWPIVIVWVLLGGFER